jgi:predicted nucleotidyltransferase component of viral defense system
MSEHGIEKIAALTNEERAEIFREAEGKMSAAAIEKDFWVCWALYRIFSDGVLSKQLLFKGGTSLSKCYGLIERFSEDIDLILDWKLLTKEDPYLQRSNTKQDFFNKEMEANAQTYVQGTLLAQIKTLLGDRCTLKIDKAKNPRSIRMTYPKVFESPYIKPEVELEIGPMSAMIPNSEFTIKPYCSDVVKEALGSTALQVKAIEAKKTFWDKITILHAEAHRPKDKNQQSRYSRHYYDVYQMLRSKVLEEAMFDLALLQEVVAFKHKFYPQSWANYEGAKAVFFKLVPEPYWAESLQRDYAQMKEMIFGEYPEFSNILQAISNFEKRLNNAKRSQKTN